MYPGVTAEVGLALIPGSWARGDTAGSHGDFYRSLRFLMVSAFLLSPFTEAEERLNMFHTAGEDT